jgi:hypothetical protein
MASAADIPENGADVDGGENEPLLGRSDSIAQKDQQPIQNNLIIGQSLPQLTSSLTSVIGTGTVAQAGVWIVRRTLYERTRR